MEIREIVFGEHNVDIEGYAHELSNRSSLSFDEIKNIFNNLSLINIQSKEPRLSQSKKKVWEKFEDNLMLSYVELVMRDGGKKSEALSDLQSILVDRTESSIPFRYYHNTGANKKANKKKLTVKTNIEHESDIAQVKSEKSDNKDDLLDVVIDIVDNVDIAGVDVNSLFKGILELSKKAVVSSNANRVEALEGQVSFLETELLEEQSKNNSLQEDMIKLIAEFENLKNEFEHFNGLSGKQKLQQMHNFNRNMKYMIDKFGGVIAVGL